MEEIMQAIVTAPAVSWARASAAALAATVAMCALVSFQHAGSPVRAGIGAVAAAVLLITAMPLLQTAHGTALVGFALVLGLASGLLYFGVYHLMVMRQWKREDRRRDRELYYNDLEDDLRGITASGRPTA